MLHITLTYIETAKAHHRITGWRPRVSFEFSLANRIFAKGAPTINSRPARLFPLFLCGIPCTPRIHHFLIAAIVFLYYVFGTIHPSVYLFKPPPPPFFSGPFLNLSMRHFDNDRHFQKNVPCTSQPAPRSPSKSRCRLHFLRYMVRGWCNTSSP